MIRLITLAGIVLALCACGPAALPPTGGGDGGGSSGGQIDTASPAPSPPEPAAIQPAQLLQQAPPRNVAAYVAKDPTLGVFVVTNRRPLDLAKKSFTDKRSDQITYGVAYQRVAASRFGVTPKKNLSLELAKPDDFFGYVKARADGSKVHPKHIAVFVHGFNQTPQKAMSTAVAIKSLLQFDGPLVLFMWPSVGAFQNYGTDRLNAEYSDKAFGELLCRLSNLDGDTRVTVLAHSMGNYLTVNTLYRLAETCPTARKLNALVMFSPDLPIATLDARGKAALGSVASATAYVSQKDVALGTSERVWFTDSFGLVHKGVPTVFEGISSINVSSLQPGFLDLITFGHDTYSYTQVMDDVYDLLSTGRTDPILRSTRIHAAKRPDNNGVYYVMDAAPKGS